MRRLPLSMAVRIKAFLFFLAAAWTFAPVAAFPAPAFSSTIQKPNQISIDSIIAAPGQTVSLTISITNVAPVGLLYMRMSYDHNFLQFQSATPALRVAGWPIFGEDADTIPGEIHIVGDAQTAPPLDSGSGPVGYLNFQVIDQPIPQNTLIPICFVFRNSSDNTMIDSAGNTIDSSQIDYVCGAITITSTDVQNPKGTRPVSFELGQNYPNPFNPSTSFSLTLPKSGRYSVRIYNLAGQVVKSFEGEAGPGNLIFTWDGTDRNGKPLASGVYFYKAEAGGFAATKRMLLIK